MPKIRLTGVYDDKLGSQNAKRVEGTRIDNGEEWSKKFFANNKKLREELDDFGVGDNVDVQMKKENKFWNINGFGEIDDELAQRIAGSGGSEYKPKKNTGSSSTGTSSGLTKEEWAEKDRLTQIRIAKAVALKAAIDNTKVGTSFETLLSLADTLVPWLLDSVIQTNKQKTKDPLDPPVE